MEDINTILSNASSLSSVWQDKASKIIDAVNTKSERLGYIVPEPTELQLAARKSLEDTLAGRVTDEDLDTFAGGATNVFQAFGQGVGYATDAAISLPQTINAAVLRPLLDPGDMEAYQGEKESSAAIDLFKKQLTTSANPEEQRYLTEAINNEQAKLNVFKQKLETTTPDSILPVGTGKFVDKRKVIESIKGDNTLLGNLDRYGDSVEQLLADRVNRSNQEGFAESGKGLDQYHAELFNKAMSNWGKGEYGDYFKNSLGALGASVAGFVKGAVEHPAAIFEHAAQSIPATAAFMASLPATVTVLAAEGIQESTKEFKKFHEGREPDLKEQGVIASMAVLEQTLEGVSDILLMKGLPKLLETVNAAKAMNIPISPKITNILDRPVVKTALATGEVGFQALQEGATEHLQDITNQYASKQGATPIDYAQSSRAFREGAAGGLGMAGPRVILDLPSSIKEGKEVIQSRDIIQGFKDSLNNASTPSTTTTEAQSTSTSSDTTTPTPEAPTEPLKSIKLEEFKKIVIDGLNSDTTVPEEEKVKFLNTIDSNPQVLQSLANANGLTIEELSTSSIEAPTASSTATPNVDTTSTTETPVDTSTKLTFEKPSEGYRAVSKLITDNTNEEGKTAFTQENLTALKDNIDGTISSIVSNTTGDIPTIASALLNIVNNTKLPIEENRLNLLQQLADIRKVKNPTEAKSILGKVLSGAGSLLKLTGKGIVSATSTAKDYIDGKRDPNKLAIKQLRKEASSIDAIEDLDSKIEKANELLNDVRVTELVGKLKETSDTVLLNELETIQNQLKSDIANYQIASNNKKGKIGATNTVEEVGKAVSNITSSNPTTKEDKEVLFGSLRLGSKSVVTPDTIDKILESENNGLDEEEVKLLAAYRSAIKIASEVGKEIETGPKGDWAGYKTTYTEFEEANNTNNKEVAKKKIGRLAFWKDFNEGTKLPAFEAVKKYNEALANNKSTEELKVLEEEVSRLTLNPEETLGKDKAVRVTKDGKTVPAPYKDPNGFIRNFLLPNPSENSTVKYTLNRKNEPQINYYGSDVSFDNLINLATEDNAKISDTITVASDMYKNTFGEEAFASPVMSDQELADSIQATKEANKASTTASTTQPIPTPSSINTTPPKPSTEATEESPITVLNMKPGQLVTLYRGTGNNLTGSGEAGVFWTSNKKKAEQYGTVEEVTLPSEIIGKYVAAPDSPGRADEFLFLGKKPPELLAEYNASKASTVTPSKAQTNNTSNLEEEDTLAQYYTDAGVPDGKETETVGNTIEGTAIAVEEEEAAPVGDINGYDLNNYNDDIFAESPYTEEQVSSAPIVEEDKTKAEIETIDSLLNQLSELENNCKG